MKTMLDHIEAANELLSSVWGEAKAAELRTYLKKWLSDWTADEHEDVLTLAATLAFWQAEGAREASWEATQRGREIEDAARKTSKAIGRFRLREQDKRETERRTSIIERHFGAALRGEMPTDGDTGADR